MKDHLEQRIAETAQLEERLFADLNKMEGMRLAFEEVLDILSNGEAADEAASPEPEEGSA